MPLLVLLLTFKLTVILAPPPHSSPMDNTCFVNHIHLLGALQQFTPRPYLIKPHVRPHSNCKAANFAFRNQIKYAHFCISSFHFFKKMWQHYLIHHWSLWVLPLPFTQHYTLCVVTCVFCAWVELESDKYNFLTYSLRIFFFFFIVSVLFVLSLFVFRFFEEGFLSETVNYTLYLPVLRST